MSYADVVLADNPVNFLKLDETTGNTAYGLGSSPQPWVYAPDAVLGQTPFVNDPDGHSVSPGRTGVCGSGRAIGSLGASMRNLSIEFWFWLGEDARFDAFPLLCFGGDTNGLILSMAWGSLHCTLRQADVPHDLTDGAVIVPGPHHVVVTVDGVGTYTSYVDGEACQIEDRFVGTAAPDRGATIGSEEFFTASAPSTRFEAVAFYGVALSDATVAAHYAAGFTPWPVFSSGATRIAAHGFPALPNNSVFQLAAEADGATAATAVAALDGVAQLAAYGAGRTDVAVTPIGNLLGQAESDGYATVTADPAVSYSVGVQVSGATAVALIYRAPIFDDPGVDSGYEPSLSIPAPMNAPISAAMDLRGTLGVLPPLLELV